MLNGDTFTQLVYSRCWANCAEQIIPLAEIMPNDCYNFCLNIYCIEFIAFVAHFFSFFSSSFVYFAWIFSLQIIFGAISSMSHRQLLLHVQSERFMFQIVTSFEWEIYRYSLQYESMATICTVSFWQRKKRNGLNGTAKMTKKKTTTKTHWATCVGFPLQT